MSERRFHAFGFGLALISSWVLAGGEDMPDADGSGTMDRALKRALELGAFEPWKEWLTFAGARTGLRCVQLDEALRVAQIAGLIWYPGPSFNRCRPLITAGGAAELVRRNGIPREVAGSWGEALLQAVQAAQAPR